ncbi:MAG: transposase [Dehalococcoidia bacterium]|nr:transposase [Dehalococcoidia bacterium]
MARTNRNGAIFKCKHCSFQLHADLNASRCIAFNFTQRHAAEVGLPVNQPRIAASAGENPLC